MANRLPPVNPNIGNALCQMIEDQVGKPCEIILIVFPQGLQPEPQFISSYPPEVMENIVRQIGKALSSPSMIASRKVDRRS
jgi:hypothetical protein